MYIAVVLLQTLVLPLASALIQLAVAGGSPLVVLGIWWAFWGVGTRLTVAAISQIANPARTVRSILGTDDDRSGLLAQELGFANLAMGLVGLVAPFLPGWGILGAAVGALFLGIAGVRHLFRRAKKANEIVATWSDLLVFVMVALGVIGIAVR